MPKISWIAILLCAVLTSACAGPSVPVAPTPPASLAHPEWEPYFAGYASAAVVFDLNQNRYHRLNPAGCAEALLPASTFKIFNALVGLETGVIPDENYTIPWDGTIYETSSWNRDHTFKTALENSVVWYFQELARRVGAERMQKYLDAVGYGNHSMGGSIDSFWLEGGLRISPDEQVEFLKKLYFETLPFSTRSMQMVKRLLVTEQTSAYLLRAKTGTVSRFPSQIGWWVGYVETQGNVFFFAARITSPKPGPDFAQIRIDGTRRLLKDLGALP